MITIVKTGSTIEPLRPRGDFEDWFAAGLQCSTQTVDATRCEPMPSPTSMRAVLITGSPAMVSHREPWSEALCPWIQDVVGAGIPLLGICYGHQLIAHALGGEVGPNPNGRQIGTVHVELREHAQDPFLGFMAERVQVQATHVESVLRLPKQATVLGSTSLDPHHVIRFNNRTWGLQFHPEFDAEITRAYVNARSEDLRAEGLIPEHLEGALAPTPIGPDILRRFAQLAT